MARREALLLLAILALAALPRLARPDLTEFKADEGRLLTAALTMAGGEFAVRGISSSVGFPNAPMSVWIYSVPLAVWPHPYAATLFTGALAVAAVGGVYWLVRRYWGVRAAAVAALLLAASPWAIVFSRKIWAQNLLPAFAVAWAITAALAFVERRRHYLILHLVLLAVAAQIHPAAVGLAPATLLFLVVFRRAVDWRAFALGCLLAALTAAPFLWHLWQRWQLGGGFALSSGGSGGGLSVESVRLLLTIASGQGVGSLAGTWYAGLPGQGVVTLLWLALVLAGAGWAAWSAARRWAEPAARVAFICLAWFVVPALVFLWQWTPVYIHYFIAAMPAAAALAGVFVDGLQNRFERRGRALLWSVLLLLAVLQITSWVRVMAAIETNPTAAAFGVPLGVKLAAADEARRLLADSDAAEILLAGDGSNPEQQEFPAEFRALLHGLPLRYVDLNREALFPAAAAALLLDTTAADGPASTRELYLSAAAPGESFPIAGSELSYAVHLLPAAAPPFAEVELEPTPLLANFARLTGYDGPRPVAMGVLWDLHWRTADNPDAADYHIFNHLLDAAGQRVAQADAAAFSGAQWRAGDVVVSRFFLPLQSAPPGPLTMRTGMYRFPSLEAVPVLDEAANPAADFLELPLTE